MRWVAVCTVLASVGTMAAAACPQADDLTDGIYVGYDDGSVTRYYSIIPDQVIEDTMFTDGSGNRFVVITLGGLFELSFVDIPGGQVDETSRERSEYASDMLAELPVAAGQTISTAAITNYADGSTAREAYTVTIEAAPGVEIGDCRYDALAVRHSYVSPEGVFGIHQSFLPELGIAIYEGTTQVGAAPESYAALWISDSAP